jgi:copper transport protein
VGAVVFLTWLWPAGRDDRRARRVVAGAWLTAVGATVLCIPLQAAYAVGGTLGDAFDLGLVADELGTRSGRSWVARLVVLAVAAVVLPRLRPGRHARSAAVAGGLALLVTVSLTGHAVSGDLVPLAFVTDVVHLSGVSVWLGGLTVIVLALLRDPGVAGDVADDVAGDVAGSDPAPGPGDARPGAGAEAERAVHGFSQVAFAAVVAIVVSGSVQAWRQVGGYDALVETTYGRLLLVKVAFVAAMLAAATASRSWVRRRAVARAHVAGTGLGAGPAQVSALRRSVAAEVGLAVAVLAVTALLVNAVPGESDTAGGGGGPYSTQVTEDGVVLSLDVDPAAVGPVALHLYLNEPNGDPVLPEEVGLTLTLPEEDLGPLTVPLVDFGQGHYSADGAELPLAGDWEVEVLVRTSDIDQTLFEAVVPVS